MGTVSVPSSTLCLISGVANEDICFFGQKETGAERVAMATPLLCHFVSFVMHNYGAKFQEHAFSILSFLVANNMTSSLI